MNAKTLKMLIPLVVSLAIATRYFDQPQFFQVLKPLSTILILGLPLLAFQNDKDTYTRNVIIALVFCLIGDVFLLWDAYFVFGLASFLVGHLFFVFAFTSVNGWYKNIIPLGILLIIVGAYYWYIYPSLNELAIPVAVYILVILTMVWQALGLYLRKRNDTYLMVGIAAVLFAFSDSVIAWDKFVAPFQWAGVIIMSTYWMAIYLLADSCLKQSSAVSHTL